LRLQGKYDYGGFLTRSGGSEPYIMGERSNYKTKQNVLVLGSIFPRYGLNRREGGCHSMNLK